MTACLARTQMEVSDNQAEVLALNQPVSAPLALGAGVGHKHKGLAEAARRLIAILAVSHMTAGHDQDRHILDAHLGGWLQPGSSRGRVCAIDDLAVKGLYFIKCLGHLFQEDVLHSGTVGDRVAVEEDARRCGKVERGDGAAVVL